MKSDQEQLVTESETPKDRTLAQIRKPGHWGDLSAQDLQKEVESAATVLYKWLLKESNPVLWRQAKLPLRGRNGFSQGL